MRLLLPFLLCCCLPAAETWLMLADDKEAKASAAFAAAIIEFGRKHRLPVIDIHGAALAHFAANPTGSYWRRSGPSGHGMIITTDAMRTVCALPPRQD